MLRYCSRCGKELRLNVPEIDPRHVFGPVGECRACAQQPGVESQQRPGAALRVVRFCVLCHRGYSPKPGAASELEAICPHCNE